MKTICEETVVKIDKGILAEMDELGLTDIGEFMHIKEDEALRRLGLLVGEDFPI